MQRYGHVLSRNDDALRRVLDFEAVGRRGLDDQ